MRWGDFRRSDNVDDRTGGGGGVSGSGGRGGGGGIRLGGGALLLVVVVGWFLGVDPLTMLAMLGDGNVPASAPSTPPAGTPGGPSRVPGTSPGPPAAQSPAAARAAADPTKEMVAHVLGDTEDTWNALFRAQGGRYDAPTLVLFRNETHSACGRAAAAAGPFYCPADREVYLDTAFFRDLAGRFGAPGDFAQAYVIAHEVGHHVQNLRGTMADYDRAARRLAPKERNALSVRLELQADCYAGIWAYHAQRRQLLEPGDVDEGLRAAAAVGDDRLQKQVQGVAVPDSFTHGSSVQRARWFRVGFDSGDPRRCDTFAAAKP